MSFTLKCICAYPVKLTPLDINAGIYKTVFEIYNGHNNIAVTLG